MRAAERAERDRAAGDVAHLAHGLGAPPAPRRACARRAGAAAARLGQLEPAAGAGEQRHAELRLEPADLLGQARLGHVQRLRGGAENEPCSAAARK